MKVEVSGREECIAPLLGSTDLGGPIEVNSYCLGKQRSAFCKVYWFWVYG